MVAEISCIPIKNLQSAKVSAKSLSSVAVGWSLRLEQILVQRKSIYWALVSWRWLLEIGYSFKTISKGWKLHSKFNIVSGVRMKFTLWAWLDLINLRRMSYPTKLLSCSGKQQLLLGLSIRFICHTSYPVFSLTQMHSLHMCHPPREPLECFISGRPAFNGQFWYSEPRVKDWLSSNCRHKINTYFIQCQLRMNYFGNINGHRSAIPVYLWWLSIGTKEILVLWFINIISVFQKNTIMIFWSILQYRS